PKIYREMIKPFHKKLDDFIKSKADVYINFHTCGSIYKLLPDIIDTGIDAINPVQVSAKDMDTKVLKEEFGDKITFWGGGCDSQWILPYGSVKEVRLEVRKRILDLAPGGGFIFAPIHNIQAEVPPQNIVAMFEAAKEYGKYPIKKSEY
ncbi:MAG: uroporphyrinogen decarboxylase family protein, partial [Nitrososphaerota archaeon]